MARASLLRRLYGAPLAQGVLFGVIAAAGYGGWAYYANSSHPDHSIASALTQASLSFVTTFIVTWLMNFLFTRGTTSTGRVLGTVTGTTVSVGVASYLVHHLAGTPNILPTIAPSVGLGAFAGSLVWSLTAVKALGGGRDVRGGASND